MHFHMHCIFVLLALIIYVKGSYETDNNVTFTSATIREGTMPKPTKKYRRYTDIKTNETTKKFKLSYISGRKFSLTLLPPNTYKPEDDSKNFLQKSIISQLNEGNIENVYFNTFDNIWSWDYWCQLQPKTGNCSQPIIRYYYDTQLDQCVNFTYSGCDGNSNNFESQQKCEQNCNGACYIPLKQDKSNYCALQPDAGICLALESVYYYDINVGDCKEFQYGGCGGNRNRFNTRKSCMRDCNES